MQYFGKKNVDSSSAQRIIEHGGIETNGLNMTPMGHMTHHYSYDSV